MSSQLANKHILDTSAWNALFDDEKREDLVKILRRKVILPTSVAITELAAIEDSVRRISILQNKSTIGERFPNALRGGSAVFCEPSESSQRSRYIEALSDIFLDLLAVDRGLNTTHLHLGKTRFRSSLKQDMDPYRLITKTHLAIPVHDPFNVMDGVGRIHPVCNLEYGPAAIERDLWPAHNPGDHVNNS